MVDGREMSSTDRVDCVDYSEVRLIWPGYGAIDLVENGIVTGGYFGPIEIMVGLRRILAGGANGNRDDASYQRATT